MESGLVGVSGRVRARVRVGAGDGDSGEEVAGRAAASEEVFIFLARYFLRWATVRRAEVRR